LITKNAYLLVRDESKEKKEKQKEKEKESTYPVQNER